MQKRVINDITICHFIELFFILGFTSITYKYNLYILLGFIPLLFLSNKSVYKSTFFFISTLLLFSTLYFLYQGGNSAFRVIKTMIVFLPFFYTNVLLRTKYSLSKFFEYFMNINAFLVCVDFCLFFLVGRTITNFTTSGFMPRPCGLLEDSNFFSYLMLIYIFYFKWKYHYCKKIYVLSLFLSGSFAAIFFFLLLSVVLSFKKILNSKSLLLKMTIIFMSISVIVVYDIIAINPIYILDILSALDVNELLQVKFVSMSNRFTTIANAMTEMKSIPDFIFGIGAGKTRTLSEIGLNMHNSLLQLFLEMGFFLLSMVIMLILSMLSYIKKIKWLIIFCVMLVLGVLLETLYSPLLSFVYFLSFSESYDYVIKKNI